MNPRKNGIIDCIWWISQFSRSVISNSVTPWTAAHQGSLSITNSWSLLKLMFIESVMPSNHLTLLLLPSIFPSIRVFSIESALRIRWPKYWSYSFNISPSNEYPRLISFRMDWLDQYSKSIQLILRPSRGLMTESPLANQSYCPEANINSFWSPSTY